MYAVCSQNVLLALYLLKQDHPTPLLLCTRDVISLEGLNSPNFDL